MIDGVKSKMLRDTTSRIFMEILRDDDVLQRFGQASFSKLYPGVINAFHYHEKQDDIWFFASGNAQVVLYDLLPDAATRGETQVVYIGDDNPIPSTGTSLRTKGNTNSIPSKETYLVSRLALLFLYPFTCKTAGTGHIDNLEFFCPNLPIKEFRQCGCNSLITSPL